jgi:probable F420-dependent oxidoreductase
VRLAESLGFDSAWVSEHHGSSDGYLPSLLPMLAAFAAATDRIKLGTGIVLTPLHDPLHLAEDAAVVDQLSNGRLLLGLGLGWREEEFRMFGVPLTERLQRTVETVEILRRAWTGKRFSFQGRSYRLDRVRVMPPPARPGGPPIYLGGYYERAVRRARRLGDGYISDADAVEDVKPSLSLFEEGAREAGKDPGALGLALIQSAFAWEDGDAWKVIRDGVVQQLGCYSAWEAGADTPENDSMELIPPDDAQVDGDGNAGRGGQGAPSARGGLRRSQGVPPHRAAALPGDGVRDRVTRGRAVRREGDPHPQGDLSGQRVLSSSTRLRSLYSSSEISPRANRSSRMSLASRGRSPDLPGVTARARR